MKKYILFIILLSIIGIAGKAANNKAIVSTFCKPDSLPRITFEKMWVDYDVKEDNVLGMRMHIKFTANNMKDSEALVAVFFQYDDERGGVLRDKNQRFASAAGDVAVYRSIKPAFATAYYDDFQVFMPYEELDLKPGTYNLLMDTKLIHKMGGTIAPLTLYSFRYVEPER